MLKPGSNIYLEISGVLHLSVLRSEIWGNFLVDCGGRTKIVSPEHIIIRTTIAHLNRELSVLIGGKYPHCTGFHVRAERNSGRRTRIRNVRKRGRKLIHGNREFLLRWGAFRQELEGLPPGLRPKEIKECVTEILSRHAWDKDSGEYLRFTYFDGAYSASGPLSRR